MNAVKPPLFARLAGVVRFIFWVLLVVIVVWQILGSGAREAERAAAFAKFQEERKSRVIALIHRQDRVSILGVPVASYISIDDSESILRAIRLTPEDQPIDLILHTPGGLVLAAEQIARALLEHKGKVTVFVPHYAMSGGTLIALAADEIVMDPNAVLGPVDPQLGQSPAASIMTVLDRKNVNDIDDQTLILADVARKALAQVEATVRELLAERLSAADATALAHKLASGTWTHDYAITSEAAKALGLPVSTEMPQEIYDFMQLFAQPTRTRPSVEYVPLPHRGTPGAGPG